MSKFRTEKYASDLALYILIKGYYDKNFPDNREIIHNNLIIDIYRNDLNIGTEITEKLVKLALDKIEHFRVKYRNKTNPH